MQRRLFGLETEYGALVKGMWEWSSISTMLACVKKLPVDYFTGNDDHQIDEIWLGNGARLYKDQSHPEYASAECESGYELVCNVLAGDEILKAIGRIHALENPQDQIKIYKSNIAVAKTESVEQRLDLSREVFWGSHENYLVSKKTPVRDLEETLLPFRATGQIFMGAGHINPAMGQFVISGRPFYMTQLGTLQDNMSAASFAFFVRTNSETSDTDHDLWKRVQVACSESNMLQFPLWMRFMTTHLCLRLAEEGRVISGAMRLAGSSPDIFRDVSRDYLLRESTVPLRSGRKRAISVQRYYLNRAKKLSPLNFEERCALYEWEWVLNLLDCDLSREENLRRLVGVLDWATKWWFLLKFMKKYNLAVSSPEMRMWNARYHLLTGTARESLWLAIEAKDKTTPFIKRVVSSGDIKKAINHPPESRAKFRSEFIRLVKSAGDLPVDQKLYVSQLDWGRAFIVDQKKKEEINFGIADPFLRHCESLERLKARFDNGT